MSVAITTASADYARSLTDRIRIAVEGTWQLIVEAYQSRSWAVLGYASWDEYCTREFGTSRLRLPREERTEQVASLRESGLSLRAIAAATGNDVKTIRTDLARVGNSHTSPAAPTDADLLAGSDWTPESPAEDVGASDDAVRTEPQGESSALLAPRPAVTGLDGKAYTRPAATPQRRKAITDAARDAGWELRKATERLSRITEDDRFVSNEEQVATLLRGHLSHAIEVCQDLLDRFPATNEEN